MGSLMSSRTGRRSTLPVVFSASSSSHSGTPRPRAVSTLERINGFLRLSTAHFSLKQRSPLRNSFIRSRRHSRQTGPVYLATGSLLDVLSPRLRGLQLGKTMKGMTNGESRIQNEKGFYLPFFILDSQ